MTSGYTAADIRNEFKAIRHLLPRPDELLQVKHSTDVLRERIATWNKTADADVNRQPIVAPRWLLQNEERVEPHTALHILLESQSSDARPSTFSRAMSCGMRALSCGNLFPQLRLPADVIRDQFSRAYEGMPAAHCLAPEVRKSIKHRSLPVPNFLLDPEDPRQFPPHIALLVVLQESEGESAHMKSVVYDAVWSFFALLALFLRLVLEVIGGSGAIWGGSEVFGLRHSENGQLWCIMSVAVGIFCLLRFVVLNAPQEEDEGDILGPAGVWSLRPRSRLRAIFEHPFHFFLRARPSVPLPRHVGTKDTAV